jgi:hypothetical protein
MNAAPGELWQYNSGGVISLGGVIFRSIPRIFSTATYSRPFELTE